MFKRNASVLRVIAMTLVMALSIFATMTMLGCVDDAGKNELDGVTEQLTTMDAEIAELEEKLATILAELNALTEAMAKEGADLADIKQQLLALQEKLDELNAQSLIEGYQAKLEELKNLIEDNSEASFIFTDMLAKHSAVAAHLSEFATTLQKITDGLTDALEEINKLLGEEDEAPENQEKTAVVVKDPAQSITSVGVIGNTGSTGGDEGGGDGNTVEAVKIVCPGCSTEGVIHKCSFCGGYYCGANHEPGMAQDDTPCGHYECFVEDKVDPAHKCPNCNYCAASGNHSSCGVQQSSSISTVSEDSFQLNGQTFYQIQEEDGVQTFALYPPCAYCGEPAEPGDGIHSYMGCSSHLSCGDSGISPDHYETCPTCSQFLCQHTCQ